MMNTSTCNLPTATHRELTFGAWKVSLDRSPERIQDRLTDFAIGMRWGALGVAAGLVAILAAVL